MKCRKFPKSFWQQPNRPNNMNISKSIVDENETLHTRTGHIQITSTPDTNLLFSLFEILKHDKEYPGHELTVKNSGGNNRDASADEDNLNELTSFGDDPYMLSAEEDCRGLKKSIRSSKNYSELLSDLVVNL